MKTWAKWIAATLGAAAVLHVLTVMAVPYAVMLLVKSRSSFPPNEIHHAEAVTAASRQIVRPSPDLLYSACPFDVSERPLHIKATVPAGTYFSISAFAENTDNFFVLNDSQMKPPQVHLVLVSEGSDFAAQTDEQVVTAPTDEGVVIFRMLIEDRAKLDELVATQRQGSCWQ